MTKEQLVDIPTLESENLRIRIKDLKDYKIWWSVWGKLFRRDFLIVNEIKFEKLQTSEDFLFVFQCLSLAKNYLRVPNVVYIWREHEDSHSRKSHNLEQHIYKWVTPILTGIKFIEDFMQKIPFFAENGDCKYVVLNFFLYIHVNRLEEIYEKVSFGQMEKILFPIFEKFGNNTFVNMFFSI